jgi:type IV secretory pathway TraG/TraD family ATPase VirD4
MLTIFKRTKEKEKTHTYAVVLNVLIIFAPLSYGMMFLLNIVDLNVTPAFAFLITFMILVLLLFSIPRLFLNSKRTVERHRKDVDMRGITPDDYTIWLTKDDFLQGKQRFLHEQIIGPTGSGKTRYLIFPHICSDIMNGAGLFIYDIKSDMRPTVEKFVSKACRDNSFYVFNLGDIDKEGKPIGDTYNPLAGGTAEEIANRCFTALYYNDMHGNQFYLSFAKNFFTNTVALLKLDYPVITFQDLYTLAINPTTLLKDLCLKHEGDNASIYLLHKIAEEEIFKNLEGLVDKLAQFAIPPWTNQINTTNPDISIAQLMKESRILLFQANSNLNLQTYKPISIMALLELTSEIGRRYSKDVEPYFIYLDEFYNVIYPQFAELINKARGGKVGIIFGHQTLDDLNIASNPELKGVILGNAQNKIVFKAETAETAKAFGEMFGTETILRKVESLDANGAITGYANRRENQFIIHPDEIKGLVTNNYEDTAEAVISIETGKGKKIKKITLKYQDVGEVVPVQKRFGEKKQGKRTNLISAQTTVDPWKEDMNKADKKSAKGKKLRKPKEKEIETLDDILKKAEEETEKKKKDDKADDTNT